MPHDPVAVVPASPLTGCVEIRSANGGVGFAPGLMARGIFLNREEAHHGA